MTPSKVNAGVARYLRAENRIVPFRERPELRELLNWCGTGGQVAMRLVTGNGGAGKTRLALELCDELQANGWERLWVRRGTEDKVVEAIQEISTPCVILVDYAETCEGLEAMLRDIADLAEPDVRVLLLARGSDEWWQGLISNSSEKVAALLSTLPPLQLGPIPAVRGPVELFDEAVAAFADELQVGRPHVQLVLAEANPLVLVIHAAALLAVLDQSLLARSASEVLDAILAHEGRYWAQSASAQGLSIGITVQRLAVAIGGLIGADNESATANLMSRIPDLSDSAERRGMAARWLHDLYPEIDVSITGTSEWIGPLRPDPVAERLIVTELSKRSELIPGLFTGLSNDRATRALTILGRAAGRPGAVNLVRKALDSDLEHLAIPAFTVALTTNLIYGDLLNEALNRQRVSSHVLEYIVNNAPSPSFALGEVAATALRLLLDQSPGSEQRLKRLLDLGGRLGELGRWGDALTVMDEANTVCDDKAAAGLDVPLADLAQLRNDRSVCLANVGQWDSAVKDLREAVKLRRKLVDSNHTIEYLRALAMSLNNLSWYLLEMNEPDEATAASQEAVEIRRNLAKDRPELNIPMAKALANQAAALHDAGHPEKALVAAQEAVQIYRLEVQCRPDALLPEFVKLLGALSLYLGEANRLGEALSAVDEAGNLASMLSIKRPAVFQPLIAQCLHTKSLTLVRMEQPETALAINKQAIDIYRRLVADAPALLPRLAKVLDFRQKLLDLTNHPAEARMTREELERTSQKLSQWRNK